MDLLGPISPPGLLSRLGPTRPSGLMSSSGPRNQSVTMIQLDPLSFSGLMSTSPLDSMILTGRQVLWARWIRWTLLVQLVLRRVQWACWIQEASCSNYTIGSTEGYWTCWVRWAHPTLGSKILLGTMSPSVLMSPLNPMSPLGPSSPLGPMSPFDLMSLSSPKSSLEHWVQWSRRIHWTRWIQRAWGRGAPPHYAAAPLANLLQWVQ